MDYPRFRINTRAMEIGSLEEGIDDITGFHLNIIKHVEDTIDGISMSGNILCVLVDEQGNEYDSLLDEDRYNKSLLKSLEFFKERENYEKCKHNLSEQSECSIEMLEILKTLANGATALNKLKDEVRT